MLVEELVSFPRRRHEGGHVGRRVAHRKLLADSGKRSTLVSTFTCSGANARLCRLLGGARPGLFVPGRQLRHILPIGGLDEF
jgi:hypothetical protein